MLPICEYVLLTFFLALRCFNYLDNQLSKYISDNINLNCENSVARLCPFYTQSFENYDHNISFDKRVTRSTFAHLFCAYSRLQKIAATSRGAESRYRDDAFVRASNQERPERRGCRQIILARRDARERNALIFVPACDSIMRAN